jgi:hypothetical protein
LLICVLVGLTVFESEAQLFGSYFGSPRPW